MRRLEGWLQSGGEIVSSWVGLSFAALYLAAVVAVGLSADHLHRQELKAQRVIAGKATAYWLSQHLSHLPAKDQEGIQREIRRGGRSDGIAFCSLVSGGIILAHSDPAHVGQAVPEVIWSQGPPAWVRWGRIQGGTNQDVLASRIPSTSSENAGRELWLGLEPVVHAWAQSTLFFWSGYVLLGVLGLFLVTYRIFRRSVQPLAVIRRRLLGCDEQLAERVVALRLNDSYDQISASWNRLIEFVSQMQEQLRKSNLRTDITVAMDGYRSERLTNILMQIPFGVLVVDSEQTVSFANRSLSGMLGTAGEPLEGRPVSEVLDEPLRMTLLGHSSGFKPTDVGSPARRGRSGASAASRWTDHTFTRPHGELTLRFWSVPGDTGEHILFVQDVTQAKEAERARDQFLYHVTHELRTPLTNIRAYAETLSQGVIDDEQTIHECYNVIMGETQRLNRLVEDILNVSQLEVGTARLEVGEVQLDRLLRSVVQDMQGTADARNIDLVLSLPPKMPQVRGDKERLAVVLTNLVGNAIKYTPEGGRVDVRCAAEDGRVRVSVADTGIGIRPEDQERIFEKFYRVGDERVSAIPGTGLGLAIVKETVRLHGGAVFVESTPGQGSTFTISLPAVALDEKKGAVSPKVP